MDTPFAPHFLTRNVERCPIFLVHMWRSHFVVNSKTTFMSEIGRCFLQASPTDSTYSTVGKMGLTRYNCTVCCTVCSIQMLRSSKLCSETWVTAVACQTIQLPLVVVVWAPTGMTRVHHVKYAKIYSVDGGAELYSSMAGNPVLR